MQFAIPFTMMRGGTSKGPFFLKENLPSTWAITERILLSAMGSPDPSKRQIDGIGGGDSLSSKVAIISKSERPDADINYLLCQVHLDRPIVETKLNCGNILSGVGPFAIEKGLINAKEPETVVRIYNENTGIIVHATLQTPNGQVTYEGDTRIDGVPGTGAPIRLNFIDSVGSKTGKLFPTGNPSDLIDNIPVSCIDVAVPMVIVRAESLGLTGYEDKKALSEPGFLAALEQLRQKAAPLMGLGDVRESVMPKICLISPARAGGTINSRYFDPFALHASHAVSGALCLGAACLIPDTVAFGIANIGASETNPQTIIIEHPSGYIETKVTMLSHDDGSIDIPEASFVRTARPLSEGNVFVPEHIMMELKQQSINDESHIVTETKLRARM